MNTHKYLFLGLFALSISSCNDFLDRDRLIRLLQNPISRLLNS